MRLKNVFAGLFIISCKNISKPAKPDVPQQTAGHPVLAAAAR